MLTTDAGFGRDPTTLQAPLNSFGPYGTLQSEETSEY